ncbi:PREDICTED: uncharacterized protein LOC109582714 isoform X1 [Amphimedon queenslandica]|nr:PREDICTED: uncharacterized protein LOC109582714 isoform X1 [Amphimedon queenslandica]|eukprot:XP_019853155.1 PREDICTED: uncharacterized protein LOC109582714 isoform X1 [Amphimedon queenslandica]
MNYTITVRAGNVLGASKSSVISAKTSVSILVGVPTSLHVNPNTNRIMWNEINCSQLTGRFIEYNVLIENIYVNELVFGEVYNISVAAVNSVGRGPFSDPIVVEFGARFNDGGVAIGLGTFVAILMILLTISLVVHIYCFVKFIYPVIAPKANKSTTKEENRIVEEMSMQECESYGLHEVNNKKKVVLYEECLPADDKHKPVVVVDETSAVDEPTVYEEFTVDDYTSC